MGHSSACASSCAVLALLGGIASHGNGAGAGGRSVSGRRVRLDQHRARRAPQPAAPARAAAGRSGASPPRRRAGGRPPSVSAPRRPGGAGPRSGWRAIAPSTSRTRSPAASGLLHTQHAQSGAPGQFRIGFVGEWFKAGFLCTDKFPCPNPAGGADAHDRLVEPYRRDPLARHVAVQRRRGHLRRATPRSAPSPTATRRTGPRSCRSSATSTSASSTWPPSAT